MVFPLIFVAWINVSITRKVDVSHLSVNEPGREQVFVSTR